MGGGAALGYVRQNLMSEVGRRRCTWIVLSPGQNPRTKEPPHLSEVFMQTPELDPVLQVFLTQHWTSVGPGQ